ncbi:uncharacterized protein [Littorina saxatilis]|uniref:uncharacterized protein n=1 Tax=Littorina saxatilis TaxID=31220 RepID=UPI0038B47D74
MSQGNVSQVIKIERDGRVYSIVVESSILDLLLNEKTDPNLKESIVTALIGQQNPSPPPQLHGADQASSIQCSGDQAPSCQSQSTGDQAPSSQCTGPHVWKDKEVELLLTLRHERQDKFLDSKNHILLWGDIVKQLRAAGCIVTTLQVINKYTNMKKKWKEALDAESKTGAGRVSFKYKFEFDQVYGTKASTRPKVVVDCRKPLQPRAVGNPEVGEGAGKDDEGQGAGKDDKGQGAGKDDEGQGASKDDKGRGKGKGKRRSDQLQDQYMDIQGNMKSFHQDKMTRMDRLLDLYEKDIESRNKDE